MTRRRNGFFSALAVDGLAVAGVNDNARDLATAAEQSQQVDHGFAVVAEPGPDYLGPLAVLAQGFDDSSKRDRLFSRNRGALFRLG
jgi:hypothetical protein